MVEENILQQDFEIKNRTIFPTFEEKKIIDIADQLIDERNEVVRSLESKIDKISNRILRDVDDPKNWQPSDYLPNFSGEWVDYIKEIQKQSSALPDELLVVLIGNMITEEGLPTYQTLINRSDSVRDLTGTQDTAWGKWTRWWTAEENRHGDLLHSYLTLIPRLNMRAIERDIQHLLGSGFDPGIQEDPYKLMVYTSFQEKATQISHLGTARIARKQGDEKLYTICTAIAKDEARHFSFYKGVMMEIFDEDTDGAITAYASMMKKTISMPAKELNSIRNTTLYTDFSEVAQSTKIYTAKDYVGIIEQLNAEWKIKDRKVTTIEAIQAQEYLLKLPQRYLKLADRRKNKEFSFDISKFDWIK